MTPTLSRTSPKNGHSTPSSIVEVRYGTNRLAADLGGWTVGEVKVEVRDRWGVPYCCTAVVNGRVSEVTAVLRIGDRLEFRRSLGFKGAENNPYLEVDLLIASHDELRAIIVEEQNVEVAVRRAVQFFLRWCGRPTSSDMPLVCELLGRIAESVAGTASSVERIAERLVPLTSAPTESAGSLAPAVRPVESPYLLAPEAALYLRSTVQTVYDWVKDGKLHPEPGFQGRLVFTRDSLDRFARTRRRS